ncbi:hypothetical protein NC651_030927 [Populus alba x Populus x berolinensis]|nr:hypothetical protein NC651_030927 [Populus alba x Populus x berolinensis]
MKNDDILKHDFLKPIEAPYSPFSSSFQATTGAHAPNQWAIRFPKTMLLFPEARDTSTFMVLPRFFIKSPART